MKSPPKDLLLQDIPPQSDSDGTIIGVGSRIANEGNRDVMAREKSKTKLISILS